DPPATHLFKRGQFETPDKEVSPGFLEVLSDPQTSSWLAEVRDKAPSGRRTALARWLTDPESLASGLVARAMVNRIWQHLFGRGLVASYENRGLSGSPPSHPELLDWLAADFRDHDWRIKRVIKQMMLSTAYRQTSAQSQSVPRDDPSPQEADPENTLLWRM